MRVSRSADHLLALTLTLMVTATAMASAQTSGVRSSHGTIVGVKAGMLTPMSAYNDLRGSFTAEAGVSGGIFVDYLRGNVSFGSTLDISTTDGYTLVDLSLTLKGRVGKPSASMVWRPGIGLGYGKRGSSFGTNNQLMLRAGTEVVFPNKKGGGFLAEVQAYGSPWGGISGVSDFTFGPGALIRAGYVF